MNTLSIQNYKRDEETNRVLVSSLIIPIDYLNDSSISQFEVESLLLHELTHILGFQYESYQYFPGGLEGVVREEEDSNGKKRFYIKTIPDDKHLAIFLVSGIYNYILIIQLPYQCNKN